MKGIIFRTEDIQAIANRRKTQTRIPIDVDISNQFDVDVDGCVVAYMCPSTGDSHNPNVMCRYKKGETFYVKETWQLLPSGFDEIPSEMNYIYKSTHGLSKECTKWRSAACMPRDAAQIFLRVENIRVEQLQEITLSDCEEEGIQLNNELFRKNMYDGYCDIRSRFAKKWNKHNVKHGFNWDKNPWVWVVEFEKIEKEKAYAL